MGAVALGCLSSLDERNFDGTGDAGEGGESGSGAAGKGGTGGSAGSAAGKGGSGGTQPQAGEAGSASGATGGTSAAGSGGTGGSAGRGGDAGEPSGGTDAGTTGTSGDSGVGGGVGGSAGSAGSDTGGAGSSGDTGSGGTTAATAGSGGANIGGSGGSDGNPSCGTSWAVGAQGYVTSPGQSGCWRGHAFTSVGGPGTTITPSSFDSCGQNCSLCVEGVVEGSADYTSYALLGVNLDQLLDSDVTNTVAPDGQSLTLSYSNTGGSLLRVQLNPPDNGPPWCYALSGQGSVTIPYSSFRQSCWDTTGAAYAGEPIVSVTMIVPGGGTGSSEPFEMCLAGLADG